VSEQTNLRSEIEAGLPDAGPQDVELREVATIEVRRSRPLIGAIGVAAALTAIAFLARAIDTGGALTWLTVLVLGLIASVHLVALLDARLPLAVADDHGMRLRSGRSWIGLPWASLDTVSIAPRRGLRDARLTLVPSDPAGVLADLPKSARRALRLDARAHGAPFALPLALGIRLTGATRADLADSLRRLADGRVEITDQSPDPTLDRTTEAALDDAPDRAPDQESAGLVPSATPGPLRALVLGRRSEVRREVTRPLPEVAGATALASDPVAESPALPEAETLRRGDDNWDDSWDTWETWGGPAGPVTVPAESLETVVIDTVAPEPVIGPVLVSARQRLGLTVDQLAERTRIRPHVIESIEVDDFGPCGGDFYARGHLRTLARILGIDVTPLLADYDERYADAPVDPRRVFEAELAHSGGIKATRGGPNWSVLVAAVMALVLAWSIARLVMDGPADLGDEAVLTGSGGPDHAGTPAAPPVPVVVSAPASGARVIVRDGAGSVVFTGTIPFRGSKTLSVSPPVRIQASDGSVTVSFDGEDRGPLGVAGSPGSGTFVAR